MTDPTGTDPESVWLAQVHRPGVPQLTLRAILVGMVLGAVMALSNLYVVLKTGWSLGVTLTACIAAWAIFRVLGGVGLARREFGDLENNAMASVASGAGYMTGGGNLAALGALLLLTGSAPPGLWLFLWFAAVASLGVFLAIPVKRQLVNVEALPFPTGTATAATIRALHARGKEGLAKARWLVRAGGVGVVVAVLKDVRGRWMPWNLPETIGLPFTIGGLPAARWTLSLETGVLMLGGGALMGIRTTASMLLGAVLTYGVAGPWLVREGIVASAGYRPIVGWSLWGASGMLVSSGLLSFAFQWRSVARSFAEIASFFRRTRTRGEDPIAAVEIPGSWFLAGTVLVGPVVVWLMWRLFAIPLWMGALTLPLALLMAVVAARVTGETDITPTKALGPLTQFVYGGLLPGRLEANVMGANATGGVGLHSADLLTVFKTGWLLGASPRQQMAGQLIGVLAGAATIVPAFALLVPDASVLGSQAFPAPASQVWAGVSRVLVSGFASLHPSARIAIVVGAGVGVLLVLAERFLPARARPWVPSASGLGIAMVIPAYNSIAMFIGSAVATWLQRRRPALAEDTVVPVASGFIAGESLMGILVALLVAAGVLGR
ncbi:MAG TPA: OPT family oligopeptide transporter [Anaeromyxobacteraceae bacterium]|nr:OPT family oligopeptide transporter [Anaeromyxobacteraceae bacterium]